MTPAIEKDPEFVKAFWAWFDALPISQKRQFWYYPHDAAQVNFYNKVWIKDHGTKILRNS